MGFIPSQFILYLRPGRVSSCPKNLHLVARVWCTNVEDGIAEAKGIRVLATRFLAGHFCEYRFGLLWQSGDVRGKILFIVLAAIFVLVGLLLKRCCIAAPVSNRSSSQELLSGNPDDWNAKGPATSFR